MIVGGEVTLVSRLLTLFYFILTMVSIISSHWVVEQARRKGRRKVPEGFSKVKQIYNSK